MHHTRHPRPLSAALSLAALAALAVGATACSDDDAAGGGPGLCTERAAYTDMVGALQQEPPVFDRAGAAVEVLAAADDGTLDDELAEIGTTFDEAAAALEGVDTLDVDASRAAVEEAVGQEQLDDAAAALETVQRHYVEECTSDDG
ncbi:hypothetical protein PO878_19085 [Iamia majanohamensis]|uniref:Secreted protein n=1 Tax=Iamia majanohamensis TaxID=467976 RepID=A0AAF0BRG3_9ACTN|nr:hypothetical protein [Iamia majanohamensis]WCO66606.1 hypothetical protein PO878_19085 [Iamia majanohamensis]